MPNEKARKIIRDALENRAVYDAMARRGAEVWSNLFVDPSKEKVRQLEEGATQKLEPGRRQLRLARILKQHGIRPQTASGSAADPGGPRGPF